MAESVKLLVKLKSKKKSKNQAGMIITNKSNNRSLLDHPRDLTALL